MAEEENERDTKKEATDAALQPAPGSSRKSLRTLSTARSTRSAVSGESCSLMPSLGVGAVIGTTSERSVHWNKEFVKEDDVEAEGGTGTGRAARRTSAADSVQRLGGGCSELEKQLRDEVRKRAPSTTFKLARVAEANAERAEVAGEGQADIVLELRRQNAKLRRELEYLNKANDAGSAVQHLHDVEAEIKSLEDKVGKLQDEVHERRAAHSRELQRRQAEVRRLVHRCEVSREAVAATRRDNQALREHITEAQLQTQRSVPRDLGAGPAPGCDDLQVKLERARGRLQRAEREQEEKKHHSKKVAHSVDSLRTLELFWSEHVTLLEGLARRQQQWGLLRDRVEMFARNIDILRVENEELTARLADVHTQLKDFVDRPMLPTTFVEKNVALLRHMLTIEATLAEKAVELDEQESGLALQQNTVRELLVTLEGLRRENRHLNRRLKKFKESQRSPDETGSHADGSGKGSSTASSRNRLELINRRTPLGSQNLSMFLMPRTGAPRPRLRDDPPPDQEDDQSGQEDDQRDQDKQDPDDGQDQQDQDDDQSGQGRQQEDERSKQDQSGLEDEGEQSVLGQEGEQGVLFGEDGQSVQDEQDEQDEPGKPHQGRPQVDSPANPRPSMASAASSVATATLLRPAPRPAPRASASMVPLVPQEVQDGSSPPASPTHRDRQSK